MSNKIVTEDGEYLKTEFTGIESKLTWYLIGSQQSTEDVDGWNHWRAKFTFDTFRCRQTGLYQVIQRFVVFEQAEAGNIL